MSSAVAGPPSLVSRIAAALRDSLYFKDRDDLLAFIPWALLFLLVLGFGFSHACNRGDCEAVCDEMGYPGFRYKARHKARYKEATPESCHCLTQEELELEGQVPKGVQVY